jgi:hypothetical protein
VWIRTSSRVFEASTDLPGWIYFRDSTIAASVKFLCDLRELSAMLFLPVRRPRTQVRGSKHPTHAAEKTASRTKLRCENANSSSVSQLVALIKNIGYVELELN